MAESYSQQAYRLAHEVCMQWLEALRPGLKDGGANVGRCVQDLERVVGCLVRLRESAQNQPGNSPETAPNQPAASLAEGTFKEGGSVSKKLKSKNVYSSEYLEGFWRNWRWRGSKHLAYIEWQKLSPDDREAASRDLQARSSGCEQWLKDNGKFVPAAERYLKRRLWEEHWQGTSSPVSADYLADIDRQIEEQGLA